jgi:hypothetical protein
MAGHKFKVGDVVRWRSDSRHRVVHAVIGKAYTTSRRAHTYDGRSTEDGGQTWWGWNDGIDEDEWERIAESNVNASDTIWADYCAMRLRGEIADA